MKKISKLVFVFSLITSQAFAAPAILSPNTALTPAVDQNRVGIVAAVRGSVKIETPAKVGRDVKSGMPIFLGDTISTNEKGNLQIMLLDQTVFTIGPNSAIVIDKFVYDPSSEIGQVNAKIVKGVFRFVTGKIGQKNPESMKVDLPSGTIGIRGTIVAGQSVGQRSFVVLLGPGERNNSGNRQGRIAVGNVVNEKLEVVVINRSGFGTVIESGQGAPSAPFKVPPEMMETITSALGSASDEDNQDSDKGESGEDSATEQAGQDTAEAEDSVFDANVDSELFGDLGDESQTAAQKSVEDQNKIADGISTFDDLDKHPGGVFKYEQSNVPLYNTVNSSSQVGTYHILFNVDFGARTVGGPASTINGSLNSHPFAFAINALPFGNGDDSAIYELDHTNTNNSSTPLLDLNSASIVFLNQGGDPGSSILHSVEIKDNTSGGPFPTGEGSGITDRQ